jgi:hypothetical protein
VTNREHTDEEIEGVEHDHEDRDSGQRTSSSPRQRFLQGAERQRADMADPPCHAMCPGGFGREVAERRHPQLAGPGQRIAKRLESSALDRDHLHDRDAQFARQLVRVDRDTPCQRLVDHVQGDDHGLSDNGELRREHQGAPNVARVHDLDDDVGGVACDDRPGDLLVFAECPLERVHARGVDDIAHLRADERTSLRDRHRGAGIVRDGRVPASQPAEDDAFADVRIADEGDAKGPWTEPEDGWAGGCGLFQDMARHRRP